MGQGGRTRGTFLKPLKERKAPDGDFNLNNTLKTFSDVQTQVG